MPVARYYDDNDDNWLRNCIFEYFPRKKIPKMILSFDPSNNLRQVKYCRLQSISKALIGQSKQKYRYKKLQLFELSFGIKFDSFFRMEIISFCSLEHFKCTALIENLAIMCCFYQIANI